jgi:hypothetical protein
MASLFARLYLGLASCHCSLDPLLPVNCQDRRGFVYTDKSLSYTIGHLSHEPGEELRRRSRRNVHEVIQSKAAVNTAFTPVPNTPSHDLQYGFLSQVYMESPTYQKKRGGFRQLAQCHGRRGGKITLSDCRKPDDGLSLRGRK